MVMGYFMTSVPSEIVVLYLGVGGGIVCTDMGQRERKTHEKGVSYL